MLAETHVLAVASVGFIQNIGVWEWVLILLVVLLLFGGRKLPDLARGLARGLRIFKDELEGVKKDVEDTAKPDSDTAAKDDTSAKDQPAKDETPKDNKPPDSPGG